jgi:anthranilate/para-aminobenzoate synthase component I
MYENQGQSGTFIWVVGITKDSNPGKEWKESVNKSMTMKRML